MGESHGVGPTQSDELLHGEPAPGEDFRDLGHGHGWSGEVVGDGGGGGEAAVTTPEENGVEGAAEHGQEVAGGGGEDVGAGDGVGAGQFEGGLGADDEVEGVAGEGEVDVGVALRLVERRGGEEDGGVAAIWEEAVVEEEADCGGRRGGTRDLLRRHRVADDLRELRTRVLVEVQR